MNETDGIIVLEPTVLNSVLEVGLRGHFRAMDDDESRNIHHHYFLSQAPPHRDVVPLNARSAETLLHDNDTVAQEYSTSTLCLALTYSSYKRTSSSQIMLSLSRRLPKDTLFFGLVD